MILIVDGNLLIHQYWHIKVKQLKDQGREMTKGDTADVVERFLTRLEQLRDFFLSRARKHGEALRCVVAFDNGEKTFRHELFPGYKQGRTKDPLLDETVAHSHESLVNAQDWTGALPSEGFEADDLIASVAAQSDAHVIIHSTDKDLHQCLSPGRVLIVKNSKSWRGELDIKYYNTDDLLVDFNLAPERWVDYQCLVGDSADKIDGALGIGHKTALKIMALGDTLEEVDPTDFLRKNQVAGWHEMLGQLELLRSLFTLNTELSWVL